MRGVMAAGLLAILFAATPFTVESAVVTSFPRVLHINPDPWLVNAVAFSPVIDVLATASAMSRGTTGGGIQLWNARTGAQLGAWQTPQSANLWGFSPDGTALEAGYDGDVSSKFTPVWGLWAVNTGKMLRLLPEAQPSEFSPDGRLMAVITTGASGFGIAELRDVLTWRSVRSFPDQGVRAATFSPDGRRVAVLGAMGLFATRVRDVQTGYLIREFSAGACARSSLSLVIFAPDSQRLITVCGTLDPNIVSYTQAEIATGRTQASGNVHADAFGFRITVRPDRRVLALLTHPTGETTTIYFIDTSTLGTVAAVHLPVATTAAFSRDGRLFAIAIGSGIDIWDVSSLLK